MEFIIASLFFRRSNHTTEKLKFSRNYNLAKKFQENAIKVIERYGSEVAGNAKISSMMGIFNQLKELLGKWYGIKRKSQKM